MNEALQSKSGQEALKTLDERSKHYQSKSRSDATKSAYRSDFLSFERFCALTGKKALPATPATVRLYITHLAELERAASTISRAMTSIRQAHELSRLPSPTIDPEVVEVWKGIKREIGTAQKRAKPLMLDALKKVVDATRPTFIGRRDVALLLVGWSAAMRRSEIVAMDREHIEFVPEGMVITIPRSKTDQEGETHRIGIPMARDEKYCPTRRLKDWLKLSGTETGPMFFSIGMSGRKFHADVPEKKRLGPRMINLIIRRRMSRAGFDTKGYTGHSLRAGFVTTAAAAKIPEYLIQLHTRHRTSESLRGYIRDGSMFSENSLATIL